MIKLHSLFLICILKNYVKSKSKHKWYYNYLPANIAEGFTLAEVLITLLIIGIVASLVIPNLINEINEEDLHTAWRKNYAEISAAFNRAKMDNGGTLVGACADGDNNCLRNIVIPYLNHIKSCDINTTNGTNQCIYNTMILKRYSGTNYPVTWYVSALQLNSGSIILFGGADQACDNSYSSSNVNHCGWILVDVNGFKGPNIMGKDFYHGWIVRNGILPVGALDQNNSSAPAYNLSSCDKSNSSAYGWGCSARFLTQ